MWVRELHGIKPPLLFRRIFMYFTPLLVTNCSLIMLGMIVRRYYMSISAFVKAKLAP